MTNPISAHPQPTRRLLRFSLRTLLLLTAVIAAWLGTQVNQALEQRAAVAAIEAADGRVRFLSDINPNHPKGWFGSWGKEYQQGPMDIYLAANDIDDTMLGHLSNMPSGSTLHLISAETNRYTNQLPSLNVVYYCEEPGAGTAE